MTFSFKIPICKSDISAKIAFSIGQKMGENNSGVNYFGLVVLLLGLGLLIMTFFTAYSFISNPESLTKFATLVPEINHELAGVIKPVMNIISYLVAALLLWVMGSVGGRITKHGLKIFESKSNDEEDTSKNESKEESEKESEQESNEDTEA